MKLEINNKIKTRRGLSSIVGALLFVVLMVATFAVLGVALNSQTNIVETNVEVSETKLKKSLEDWRVNISANSTDHLSIEVKNDGQNHVEITDVVITNATLAPNFPTKIHEIPYDTSLVASEDEIDVVSTMGLKLDRAEAPSLLEKYEIKVISSLGTVRTGVVECNQFSCQVTSGDGSVSITMIIEGANGINTQPVTALLFVSNNSEETINNLRPTNGFDDPLCNDLWSADDTAATEDLFVETILNCTPETSVETTLGPHETTIFRWTGTISGDVGSTFRFCTTISGTDGGGPIDAPSESCDTLTIINPNDCGGCGEGGEGGETIILIDDLLIRPSIFMVIPSPFGDTDGTSDAKGIWGINLANPTDKDMEISKVTIVAYPPGGASQDNVFSSAEQQNQACLEEDIEPNVGPQPGGYWDCPRDNILVWDGLADPVTLEANSTKSFLVKVEPQGVKPGGSPANLDALIVQANVWSTFGSFGKSGYQSTMYLEKTSVVNTYLSDSTSSRDTIIGYVNDIPENSTSTYNAVLADMDDDPSTTVNIGARLIANVPREWEFVGFNGDPSVWFDTPIDVTQHSDGSTQIIATTKVPIGDGTNDAVGISFDITAPDVNYPRLYVMYLLADGTVTVDGVGKTIGPLNEIVLNVDP